MDIQRRIALAITAGILGAFLVHGWWYSEIASFIGDAAAQNSFHCLVIAGTEDCAALSLIGLHEENLIASLLYYGFVGLAIWGFVKAEA